MADLGELIARVGLDTSELKRGVAESEGLLSGGLAGAAAVAAAAIAAIGVAAVGFGIASAHKFEDVGKEVLGLQRIAGGTVEDMSRLRFAAEEVGITSDRLGGSLRILSGHLATNDQAAKDMGVAYRDANGNLLPTNEILLNLADRFASMPNGIEKTRLATELFGRTGTDMIPILNKGRDGLLELEAAASKFGLVLTTENIDAIRSNIQAHKEWHAAWEGLQVQIGIVVLPLLTALATFMSSVLVPAIGTAARFAREVLAPAFQYLLDLISTVMGKAKTAWDLFIKGFTDPTASDNLSGVANLFFEFGQGVRLGLEALKHAWDLLVEGFKSPVVFRLGQDALKVFDDVKAGLAAIGTFITDSLIPGLSAAFGAVQGPLGDFVGYIRDIAPQVQEAVTHIVSVIKAELDVLGGIFAAIFVTIKAAWSQWGDDVMRIVRVVFDGVKAYIETAIRVVRDIINGVLALINGDWGDAWAAFSDIPRAAFDLIKTLVGDAMKIIGDLFATGWDTISQAVPAAFGAMFDFFKALPSRIISAMGSLTSALVGAGHDVVTGFYNGVLEAADKLLNFFRDLPSTIERLIGSAVTWLRQDGIDTLVGFINGLIDKVKDVTHWIATELPKKITDGTASAVDWLKDAAPKIIDGLIDAIKVVMENPSTVAKIVGAIVGGLALAAIAIPSAVGILGGAIILGIIEGMAQEIGKLTKWVATELPAKLQSAASGAAGWLASTGQDIMTGLWNGLKAAWNTVSAWASGLGGAVGGWFGGAVSWLANAGQDVMTGLWNGLKGAWNTVSSWASGIPGAIPGWFSGALSWLGRAGQDIMTGLWNGLKAAWNTVSGWGSGIFSAVGGWFGDAVSWLAGAGQDVMTGLWNGLKGAWNTVSAWGSGIFSAIGGWFYGAATWLYNAGIDLIMGFLNGMIAAMDHLPGIVQRFTGLDAVIRGLRNAVDTLNGAKIEITAQADTAQAQKAVDDLVASLVAAGGFAPHGYTPSPLPPFAVGGLTHGPSLAGEKGQELILPLGDLQRARQLLAQHGGAITGASGGSAGTMGQSSVTNYNLYGPIQAADPAELERQLQARARVASMAGR